MKDELLDKIQQMGYTSIDEFLIKNWEEIKPRDQKILQLIGVSPTKQTK